MPSSVTTWWMTLSRRTTRALGVRGRSRGSASVSVILGAALLFGATSLTRSDRGDQPRLSSEAVSGTAAPALHSSAHRTLTDTSFVRRWLPPLDVAHPARAVSVSGHRVVAADRVTARNDAAGSSITARGYDATAPPGSMG